MKKMRALLLTVSILTLLSSCVNDAWIGRKVVKATPERMLVYLESNYPHLFETKIDTIRDTVVIKALQVDTAFKYVAGRTDTMYLTKERLKVRVITRHDSIFVTATNAADTVFIEKECPPHKLPIIVEGHTNYLIYGLWFVGLIGLVACFIAWTKRNKNT